MNQYERMKSPEGLATSCGHDDAENTKRMKFILDTYLSGKHLEFACRTSDNWETVDDLPMNFEAYRFRYARDVG